MQGKPALERAFELADTGTFKTVTEIKLALAREGYRGLGPLLEGQALRKQLRTRIKQAEAGLSAASGTLLD